MTATSNKPDLQRIGQSAFMEVLSILLSLPSTVRDPSCHTPFSTAPPGITSAVQLVGQQLSGSVHVQLPIAFVARAVQILTGLNGDMREAKALQEDTAGELTNMVAGRVAAQLGAEGYPCTLTTPSVSRGASLPIETEPGMDHGRMELFCDGHWLSLELKCRYTVP